MTGIVIGIVVVILVLLFGFRVLGMLARFVFPVLAVLAILIVVGMVLLHQL